MRRGVLILIGVLLLTGSIVCAVLFILSGRTPAMPETEAYAPPVLPTGATAEEPQRAAERTAPESPAEPTPAEAPAPTPYISPIDFEGLQAKNPDIYSWIEIADTNISLPVVQSPDSDTYYLNHNSDREYAAYGAVFSEATYNHSDLTDPVTILYGHHMRSGRIFGQLQRYYSDAAFFDSHPTITVYTPEQTLEYGVFAAVPYSGEHLLYYNDFSDEAVFERFFEAVFSIRELSAHFNEEYAPTAGDRVLILSTCLEGNNQRRFLVMATLIN